MDLLAALSGSEPGPESPRCSRKGCTCDAQFQIGWNNPKIHDAERRKYWLACAEHLPYLENFLGQRLFWRSTEALTPSAEADQLSPSSRPEADPGRQS